MNEKIEHCLYQAGLTAQGCWEDLDTYTQEGIKRFAELIVKECADVAGRDVGHFVLKHFGVEEQSTEPNELHTCPYAEEIHGDYETLCDCDEERTRQCAMDV